MWHLSHLKGIHVNFFSNRRLTFHGLCLWRHSSDWSTAAIQMKPDSWSLFALHGSRQRHFKPLPCLCCCKQVFSVRCAAVNTQLAFVCSPPCFPFFVRLSGRRMTTYASVCVTAHRAWRHVAVKWGVLVLSIYPSMCAPARVRPASPAALCRVRVCDWSDSRLD